MRHTETIQHVRAAGFRVHEFACDGGGRAAVCALAGRVISLRFPGLDENIFWSSPELPRSNVWRKNMWGVTGGIGGLRLWFAPEYAYHWTGKPDLIGFTTYQVPRETDPGRYEWGACTKQSANLRARVTLRDHRDGSRVSFDVQRTVAATGSPVAVRGVRYVGIRLQHVLTMLRAQPGQRADLWHIMQMPVGSRTLIPTMGKPTPQVYFNALKRGSWKIERDCVTWHYTGDQCAKIGFDTAQVTGRAGVLRRLSNGEWAAVILHFPVRRGADYCDGPDGRRARQQVSQAWDGFGFGELEYHSPAVSNHDPVYAESALVWCFAGTQKRVNEIAACLLGRRW